MQTVMDFFLPTLGSHLQEKKFKNLMKLWWPTEFIDGVEVFTERLYVYPFTWMTPNTKKFLQYTKMYDGIHKQSYNDIDYAYVYLNPSKAPSKIANTSILTSAIHTHMIIDTWYDYQLNISVQSNTHALSLMTLPEAQASVLANYAVYHKANQVTGLAKIQFIQQIAPYLHYGGAQDFTHEVLGVVRTITPNIATTTNQYTQEVTTTVTGYTTVIALNMRSKRIGLIDENTPFILSLAPIDNKLLNVDLEQIAIEEFVDEFGITRLPGWLQKMASSLPLTDGFYYKGHIRVACTSAAYLRTHNFFITASKAIDFGYKVHEPDKHWYDVVVVILVIVVAVVIAVVSAGTATAASAMMIASATGMSVGMAVGITVAATAMMLATLGLTALSYGASKWGDGGLAQTSIRWSVVIGKVALVLGITQIIAQGMSNWAAAKAAAEIAAKEAGKAALEVTVIDIIKELVMNSVKDMTLTSMAKSLVSPAIKLTNIALDRHYRNNLDDIMTKVRKSQKELDEENAKIEAQNADPRNIYVVTQIPFSPLMVDRARYDIDREYGGNWRNIGQEFFMGVSTRDYKY